MMNIKSIATFVALASLSVGLPEKRNDAHITLGPGPVIPKGCFTLTTTVPNTQPTNEAKVECPLMTKCGIHANCDILKVVTVNVPCPNDKCPFTPTVTVAASASCPTCQKGCLTDLVTTTATTGCKTTSSAGPTYY
ncbi:hypothetical protein LSUE1_G007066 [Lachnellula suecica]|uniref:Uncharacterized protein n=1 Tax=Lachnellula suecica TaxID=602035 RepID=A0A8T9BWJ8_9HELO|nr:hypothetical protein LSUE1_G007066 [Lachnellula suecica]